MADYSDPLKKSNAVLSGGAMAPPVVALLDFAPTHTESRR